MDGYNRRASQSQPWNQPLGQPRQYYTRPGQYQNQHPGTLNQSSPNGPVATSGPTSMPMTSVYNNAGQSYDTEKNYESSYSDWMKQLTDYLGGGGTMGGSGNGFDWTSWMGQRPQIGGYNY